LVIESASVLTGIAVGMFFAELGPRIIKIENLITEGHVTRKWKLFSEDTKGEIFDYFSSEVG
jgi:crotonobetainyl-CoA:carnitine CoA-transferase CaiB-like acyl-CoA transferase